MNVGLMIVIVILDEGGFANCGRPTQSMGERSASNAVSRILFLAAHNLELGRGEGLLAKS